jgi:hypothetical protein
MNVVPIILMMWGAVFVIGLVSNVFFQFVLREKDI